LRDIAGYARHSRERAFSSGNDYSRSDSASSTIRVGLRDLNPMHGAGRFGWIKLNFYAKRLKPVGRQAQM
jgi:hypothetical protein